MLEIFQINIWRFILSFGWYGKGWWELFGLSILEFIEDKPSGLAGIQLFCLKILKFSVSFSIWF